MGRILAIDYGTKRTGLAWTDPMKIIATGLEGIETVQLKNRIKELISQEEIEKIVLGFPSKWNGKDTDATSSVREFNLWLKQSFPHISIHLMDERFTSNIARKAMLEGGLKKKKRKDKHLLNEISAVIILQDYLRLHPE